MSNTKRAALSFPPLPAATIKPDQSLQSLLTAEAPASTIAPKSSIFS